MKKRNQPPFPFVEIFGGTLGILVILYVLLNLLIQTSTQQQMEENFQNEGYKINWSADSAGFVVMAFKDRLDIIETGQSIPKQQICSENTFSHYAQKVYQNQKQQIIFAILEGGVETMRLARDCLQNLFQKKPITIGWIIANEQFLKAISVNQIPAFIKDVIKN